MPKATVNKEDDPLCRKQKIRISVDLWVQHPAGNSLPNESKSQASLGGTIASRPHLAHQFATLLAAKNIHTRLRIAQDAELNYHSS